MKSIVIILISSFFLHAPERIEEKWLVDDSSNLRIEGSTNVNTFNCSVTKYLQADTLIFFKNDPDDKDFLIRGKMIVNVNGFECQKRYMNADLKKTLKAKESPFLSIQLISIGDFTNTSLPVRGTLSICLAGVKKSIEADYTVHTGPCGRVFLNGKCNVLFSDFGLTPPRKLSGLVTVNQEINVNFLLVLVKA